MRLRNMIPGSAACNVANSGFGNIEIPSKYAKFFADRATGTNHSYRIIRQFCSWVTASMMVGFAANKIALSIFRRCNIFKITQSTVTLAAFAMIDLIAMRTRTKKSMSNQEMYPYGLPYRPLAQQNPGIGIISLSAPWLQHSIRPVTIDTAKARHTIESFPFGYIAPLFGFQFFGGKFLLSHSRDLLFRLRIWLGPARCFRSVLACFIIAQLSAVGSAQISQKEILQQCRAALVDLQRAREVETTLRAKISELEAADRVSQDRMKALESAVVKYEAAIAARTQAETLVSEIRSNYEHQLSVAEKQLAIEQGKTNFWRTFAKLGLVMGLVVGAVAGYAIGNN